MLNQENFKGFWSPAARPDIRFFATLAFGPDQSPRLTGVGTFTEEQTAFLRNTKEMTVWGDLEDGESVSLFECNCLTAVYPLPGTQNLELNAHTVIFGTHLKGTNEAVVEDVQVNFTVLLEWMDTYGHTTTHDKRTETHSLLYKAPEDVRFSINDGLNAAFVFRVHREVEGGRVSFRQENLLFLHFVTPVSYELAQEAEWRVQRFLTVAVWQQLNIGSLSIRIKTSAAAEHSDGYKWCRVFFKQLAYGLSEAHNKTYFLQFAVVRPHIEMLLQTWFSLEELIEPVISLLTANIGVSDGFIQNNFLNLAQAVEAFHRHIKQDTEKLKTEHEVRVKRILEKIEDPVDKKWLDDKLMYSFEPSLRKRLKEMFREHSSVVFYNNDFKKKALDNVIDAIYEKRNYYTHYGEKLVPKDEDYMRLITLTELLKALLAIMIFRELGIDKEVLRERIPGRLKVRLVSRK